VSTKKQLTIGIILNPRKEEVIGPLKFISEWIAHTKPHADFLLCTNESKYLKDIKHDFSEVSEQNILERCDMILTLGGDGTILRTVKAIGERTIPVMGVNLGGLGFLADTPTEALLHHLQAYINGDYYLEERSLLKCIVENNKQTFYAFNDIVIDKSSFSRVIEIITHVDGHLLNSYIADGLILSSPSGSTGYSLSAGGPIVIPQTKVFVINPICPHSLTNRPVVVSDLSKITIQVFTEYKEICIFRDGEKVGNFPSGSSFIITKAEYPARLIKMKSHTFFTTLRNKLHWGEDFRDKKRWTYKPNS